MLTMGIHPRLPWAEAIWTESEATGGTSLGGEDTCSSHFRDRLWKPKEPYLGVIKRNIKIKW